MSKINNTQSIQLGTAPKIKAPKQEPGPSFSKFAAMTYLALSGGALAAPIRRAVSPIDALPSPAGNITEFPLAAARPPMAEIPALYPVTPEALRCKNQPDWKHTPEFPFLESERFNSVLYEADGQPKKEDMAQWKVGVCYFEAPLLSLLNVNPNLLQQMIRPVPSKIPGEPPKFYTVILHANGIATEVCVDSQLIESPQGETLGSRSRIDPASGKKIIWPSLMVKAWAKLNDYIKTVGLSFQHGYEAVGMGGDSQGIYAIGGEHIVMKGFGEVGFAQQEWEGFRNKQRFGALGFMDPRQIPQHPFYNSHRDLIELPDGSTVHGDLDITQSSILTRPDGEKIVLVSDHAFGIMDVIGNNVRARNPWNCSLATDGTRTAPAEFELDIETLRQVSNYFVSSTLPKIAGQQSSAQPMSLAQTPSLQPSSWMPNAWYTAPFALLGFALGATWNMIPSSFSSCRRKRGEPDESSWLLTGQEDRDASGV
jgi:hypothetical protein